MMKLMFGRTTMWVWLTVCFAAVAFAAVQDLPEGEGKVVLEGSCEGCHSLDRIKTKHYDMETWEGVVEAMRSKRNGPVMTDEDVKVLATYLTKSFGPMDAKPADAAPAGQTDADFKQLVQNSCSTCHGMDLVESQKLDKAGWEIIIKNMVAMGAPLTEAQVPAVADYLAKTYK